MTVLFKVGEVATCELVVDFGKEEVGGRLVLSDEMGEMTFIYSIVE